MKYIIVTSSLLCLLSGIASAQTCQTIPSCESLGYTSSPTTDCPVTPLKCPFDDSKTYCPESSDCVVGAIYYSDGTCSQENYEGTSVLKNGNWEFVGKRIVGVVALTGLGGYAIAINDNNVSTGHTQAAAKQYCSEKIIDGHQGRLPTKSDVNLMGGTNPGDGIRAIKIGLLKAKGSLLIEHGFGNPAQYWTDEEGYYFRNYNNLLDSYQSPTNYYNSRCVFTMWPSN